MASFLKSFTDKKIMISELKKFDYLILILLFLQLNAQFKQISLKKITHKNAHFFLLKLHKNISIIVSYEAQSK